MTEQPTSTNALVIGAGGGIGAAVAHALLASDRYRVFTVSRDAEPPDTRVAEHWVSDYSAASIRDVGTAVAELEGTLERLVIANGILHGEGFGPERSLRQLDETTMLEVLRVNAVLPMQWLSSLFDTLKRAHAPRVVVLSARVGSIGDNHLGGWYSYRGSKAALNMMLQCSAIELHRVNRRARVIAFHPGTTDTSLSKPFQKNVSPEKLFSPAFVAERLLEVTDGADASGDLAYLDWAGKTIPW